MSESSISHIRAEGAPPLLIRADAGGTLGTGHVMRMLALAHAWMAQGGTVYMALLTCPGPLLERLRNEEIHIISLDQGPRGSGDDAGQLIQSARNRGVEWIVIDGYDFGLEYQRQIKKSGTNLMVMDDYGYSPTWCADIILNQNLGAESFTYTNEIPTARTLLGPNYVLLRKEFWKVTPKTPVPGQPIRKVLITLGGVDADNVTGRTLEALESAAPHLLELHVILGPGNPHLSKQQALATSSRHEIQFLQNITDMSSQYRWADGVISAGGSTCYEWMRFGLPAAVIQIADNQAEIYHYLVSSRYAIGLGISSEGSPNLDVDNLSNWLSRPESSVRSSDLVDGYGAFRVVNYLQGSQLTVRKAQPNDCDLFLTWANDSAVRNNSFSPSTISYETHVKWFTSHLYSPNSQLLVGTDLRGSPVGQIRFDLDEDRNTWIVDISIDHKFRGKGFGKILLAEGLQWLRVCLGCTLSIHAEVLESNKASQRLFEQNGFKLYQTGNGIFIYSKTI